MSGPFKVAAVQAAPVFLDLDATVEKAVALIDDAGKQGVKLIAFPETWVPGYPWWIWLGAPAWGMQFVGRYFENAIEAGSPQDEALAAAAKRNGMQVVIGVSERAGGSLYMGQWHYGAHGEIISRRRKLKPTHVERTVFGEGDGSDMIVSETNLGRVGALCCWEHLQPLTKYAMYAQNEQIHIASWPSFSLYRGAAYALGPELNTSASQMYAAEGQCFVIASCATVSEEMFELLCDTPDKQQFLQPGGGYARIFAPDGSPVGEPLGEKEEGLLVAEIDLSTIAYAKAAADPVGHYSRPDVFRLMFNQNPNPVVMPFDEGIALATEYKSAVQEEGRQEADDVSE
ncbi:carbon-nitrogen hydrolase family protein [Denitrobaculum tricleocarpae]|uniref:Carbon-nitrogen hydrolase family protein n=1 Tax=Denitrobaculum tricleocarpae TaxID=2591009 RepID=A0A545TKP2_9PROT|nr:carbon-nitrogen hydrolase family protein [Denitrobaculum tricleocarpae]TQV77758.1 carbon-nitrogen hydrolase family protein [Denitrobaculum tricleocarpae]